MDKENVACISIYIHIHTHKMEYLLFSLKNEENSAITNNMGKP